MNEDHLVPDPQTIRALIRLVEENALAELTLEGEGYSISLKAEGIAQRSAMAPSSAAAFTQAQEAEQGARAQIRAPMTGMFYRASAPSDPPLIEVGDRIEVGQVVGLIEAMKVFSEVPAEVAGRVIDLPVKNGDLVHQDQVLVVLGVDEEDAG